MSFEQELFGVLPHDLPNRDSVARQAARHLDLIVETNRQFNLTRIVSPREAAIKHVLDSVLPWRHFSGAHKVLDAGTGAGFPGIPLALVLPEVHFTLTESTGKKARFTADAVKALGLTNVDVLNARAEQVAASSRPDVITARALAPLARACQLFAPALRNGSRGLLYKGPDIQTEMLESSLDIQKSRVRVRIIDRFDLPDQMGLRTIVEMAAEGRRVM